MEIRLTRGLGLAFLAVSDEGPSLPDEVADKMFDSMISSRPGDNTGKVHLGLGFTIVRAIADFQLATVNAINRHDPEGVTVTVAFPLLARP